MGNLVPVVALLKGVAAAVAGVAVLCNLPTSWWLPAQKATLQYLSAATLQTLDDTSKKFKATDLWQYNGAVIMAVRRPG